MFFEHIFFGGLCGYVQSALHVASYMITTAYKVEPASWEMYNLEDV